MHHQVPTSRRLVMVATLAALLVSACGGSDPATTAADATAGTADATSAAAGAEPTTSPTTADPSAAPTPGPDAAGTSTASGAAATFPVTIDAPNGPVEILARPERVVSLSPTSTEVLFAIGAGDQVAAVDSLSTHPPEAPTTDLAAFEASVEAISELDPDLVVLSFDPGETLSGLDALGIPALLHPTARSLADSYDQMRQLGAATGNRQAAEDLVAALRADLEAVVAAAPTFDDPPTYYLELDPTFYTATSDTFMGELFGLLGLRNIADRAEGAADAGGFPQLSPEFIVESDPDVILLADTGCCDVTADVVAQRPGWGRITAVRDRAVVPLDDDLASRWGPRMVDLLRTVADRLTLSQAAA